eukprot:XP_015578034.1 DEAD-box ATP-dependent RNA helicase 52C-like [Ricinus communis]
MSLAKGLVELMKEAQQEVPSWLNQYADNSSYGVSGGGRTKRYGGSKFGGSKFGGYDFRSDAQSSTDNYYNSSAHGDADPVGDACASSGPYGEVSASTDYYGGQSIDAGYAFPAGSDSYVASQGYEYGHEAIVASGWD